MRTALTSIWYYATLLMFAVAIVLWWLPVGGTVAAWAILSTLLYIATDWMTQYWDNIPKGVKP